MLGIEHTCGSNHGDSAVAEEDEDEDDTEDATVVVSLMQKVRGTVRPHEIAYTLSKVREEQ